MTRKKNSTPKPAAPKRRMQNVSFRSVDDFFDFLPEKELELVNILRDLIFECIPECREKLSWNVPTYHRHGAICFLWPSSVTWGNVKQKGAVRLGFAKGTLLPDAAGWLDKGYRKVVAWHDFSHPSEINVPTVKMFLLEAALLDAAGSGRK
jgi:hypothetical protein